MNVGGVFLIGQIELTRLVSSKIQSIMFTIAMSEVNIALVICSEDISTLLF